MADAGPPAHLVQPAQQASQAAHQPVQPVQPPIAPDQPVHTQQIQHITQLNWSYCKPELPGKPEEDAEAHLLRTNNWMETHTFPEGVKVQRFCLTLVGEARLWGKSLRPINVDWQGLENQFRQQCSKIGNARERLFHALRSFHFEGNTDSFKVKEEDRIGIYNRCNYNQ